MSKSARFSLTSMVFCFVLLAFGITTQAQTAEFTYRGTLDASMLADTNYDFEFTLWDSASGGNKFGTRSLPNIYVNLVRDFTVSLDFGAAAFDGSARYLEIGVRPAGTQGAFTLLTPRAVIISVPYAIRSASAANSDLATLATNASQLAGLNPDQLIQNTTAQQASTNFNISGTGIANIFDAVSQYKLFGRRFLGADFGFHSTYVGDRAGEAAFNWGSSMGNTFVGYGAGESNRGMNNVFVGLLAGNQNTGGYENSFFGVAAGNSAGNGEKNTAVGANANFGSGNLTNATAIGAYALVTQSNSLVLGSIKNPNYFPSYDTKVGIGTTAPAFKLHIIDESSVGLRVQSNTAGGTLASFGGLGSFQIDAPGFTAGRFQVLENGNVGIGTPGPTFKLQIIDSSNRGLRVQTNLTGGIVASYGGNGDFQVDANGVNGGRFVIKENGKVGIGNPNPNDKLNVNGNVSLLLGSGGTTQVCQNSLAQLSTCGSSLRYKTNVNSFFSGLSLLNRLRPVSFNWKANNLSDFGLVAEEVEQVEPLLVTHKEKGEVEGVKYDRLGVVLINAIREQQAQIKRQQEQIEVLRKLVCSTNAAADICKQEKQ